MGLLSYDPYDIGGSAAGSLMTGGGEQTKFSSADGKFHVVFVEAPGPFANYNEAIAWVEKIRARHGISGRGATAANWATRVRPPSRDRLLAACRADMQSSAVVTLVIIAFIFWFCYRRFRPLLALQGMLLVVFAVCRWPSPGSFSAN